MQGACCLPCAHATPLPMHSCAHTQAAAHAQTAAYRTLGPKVAHTNSCTTLRPAAQVGERGRDGQCRVCRVGRGSGRVAGQLALQRATPAPGWVGERVLGAVFVGCVYGLLFPVSYPGFMPEGR